MRPLLLALIVSCLCCSTALGFESELIPLELNHIFAKEATSLDLHKEPSSNSPVTNKMQITKREEIFFDQSRTRTIKTGKMKVKKNITLSGKSFGNISYLSFKQYDLAMQVGETKLDTFRLKKGQIIEELHNGPEGSCIAKWQDKVLWLEFCPWHMSKRDFEFMSEPAEDEWWIRVTKNDKPLGWLLIDLRTPIELD